MNTIIFTAEINSAEMPKISAIMKELKGKFIKIEEKNDAKMSKEEYFKMIDKSRQSKKKTMSREELRKIMFE